MADNNKSAKPPTHTAYTFRRLRKSGCWEKCGDAWYDKETGNIGVIVRMTPVGGFSGLIQCRPIDQPPPDDEAQRPGDDADEEI